MKIKGPARCALFKMPLIVKKDYNACQWVLTVAFNAVDKNNKNKIKMKNTLTVQSTRTSEWSGSIENVTCQTVSVDHKVCVLSATAVKQQ